MSLKYRKRLGVYTNSSKTNVFNPVTLEATSYRHWLYCAVINRKVVFNNYNYSSTTNRHQRDTRQLIYQLGIKIDVFVNMRDSLSKFNECALSPVYREIETLTQIIKTPRTHKNVNAKRKLRIKELLKHSKTLKKLGASISKSAIESIQHDVRVRNEKASAVKFLKKMRLI